MKARCDLFCGDYHRSIRPVRRIDTFTESVNIRGFVVFRIVERVINGPWVPIIGGHGVLVSARHTRPT